MVYVSAIMTLIAKACKGFACRHKPWPAPGEVPLPRSAPAAVPQALDVLAEARAAHDASDLSIGGALGRAAGSPGPSPVPPPTGGPSPSPGTGSGSAPQLLSELQALDERLRSMRQQVGRMRAGKHRKRSQR